MQENYIEKEVSKAVGNSTVGLCAGFVMGFILGATIVAVIDHLEIQRERARRIRSGADENYITSE